jgi:hypothetical protein
MFRPVIVSTAVLCGLFLAVDAAPKSPNIPNTPKITIPRPPAANRILVLPRTITVPRNDDSSTGTSTTQSIDGSVTVTAPYTTEYNYEDYGADAPVSRGQRPFLAPGLAPAAPSRPSRPSTGVFKIPVPQQAK